jgi:tight adherence protein B
VIRTRNRARRSLALGLLLALVAPLLAATAVGAQEDDGVLAIRSVDSRDRAAVALDFLWTGNPDDVNSLTLTENGQDVQADSIEVLPADNPRKGVMFVIDTSIPMEESGALTEARAAIRQVVEGAAPGTEFGLVLAGDRAAVLENLTTSKAQIYAQLDQISATPVDGGALWGATRIAAASLTSRGNLQPNVIVIAGSDDEITGDSAASARGEVYTSGAAVFVAGFTGEGLDRGAWEGLASRAGGVVRTTDDPLTIDEQIVDLGSMIQTNQYRITFESSTAVATAEAEAAEAALAEEEEREADEVANPAADLRLEVGGESAGAIVVLGGYAVGKTTLQPTEIPEATGVSFLQGGLGLAVTMIVVLLAAVLLIYGLSSIFVRDDTLSAVLQPYSESYGGAEGEEDENRSALVKRAVEITEQVAESQGYLSRVEASLERASIPLRAGEALTLYAAIVLLVTVGALALFGLVMGVVVGAIAAITPVAVVNFKAAQRRRKFLSQLPDMLQLLSGTLRAGYSLLQGVEAVSQESEDPMGYELRRVVTESRLGRPLEEALDSTAIRMDSPDFAWAVMAIRIQREVGGNLSELLLTVAETMIARERLRRDVASLTAEGRISAIILGILPVGLGLVMYTMNPDYMSGLLDNSLGISMLIGAFVMMGIGFAWMKKIINIEI